MINLQATTTTTEQNIRFLQAKELKQYWGLKNNSSVKKRREDYLLALGKALHLPISNFDIYKIDGIWL
jgi:hypothetical protein